MQFQQKQAQGGAMMQRCRLSRQCLIEMRGEWMPTSILAAMNFSSSRRQQHAFQYSQATGGFILNNNNNNNNDNDNNSIRIIIPVVIIMQK
jgi:hypothetical protein